MEFDSLLTRQRKDQHCREHRDSDPNQGHSNTETLVALEQANQSFAVFLLIARLHRRVL